MSGCEWLALFQTKTLSLVCRHFLTFSLNNWKASKRAKTEALRSGVCIVAMLMLCCTAFESLADGGMHCLIKSAAHSESAWHTACKVAFQQFMAFLNEGTG
jgi:hypothetical protein